MFIQTNPNPLKRNTGDCTIRAICLAMGNTWDDAAVGLFAEAFDLKDMPSSNRVWGSYLDAHGFTREPLKNTCPLCYTVRDFAAEHPDGTYIVACQSHVVCVSMGDIYDAWDSSDETALYYWKKER